MGSSEAYLDSLLAALNGEANKEEETKEEAQETEEIAENKNGQYDGIYMNRLIDGLYTPGSTFKIITAASVIENKKDMDSWEYTCEGETTIDGVKVELPALGCSEDGTYTVFVAGVTADEIDAVPYAR